MTIISFTAPARAYVQAFINKSQPNGGFRVATTKSGCSGFSYVVDAVKEPQPGDVCLEDELRIFIDPNCIEIIRGMVISLEEKAGGQKQLVFRNPNAEHFCGCGESFTVAPSPPPERGKVRELDSESLSPARAPAREGGRG